MMVNPSFLQAGHIPWLSESECIERLAKRPSVQGPMVTFSSLIGGWTDSSYGALVGIDDHGFHRGDGVFEALKVINRKPYLLEPHDSRMRRSAAQISLQIPYDFNQVQAILEAGIAKFPDKNSLVRIYATRGGGGFSTNPQECLAPGYFMAITPLKHMSDEKYAKGVTIGKSAVPIKPPWMATTKSLNYLPNVMMKKESLDRGLDFTVTFNENGVLGESSTENIVVLTKQGTLAYPPLAQILRGCTMMRLFDLVEKNKICPIEREKSMTEKDLLEAQGAFMVGTTLDAIPVASYEQKTYAITPFAQTLRELIQKDQL